MTSRSRTARTTGSVRKRHRPSVFPSKGSYLRSEVLIIFRGRLIKTASKRYSIVKTNGALLRVWWAGDELPPMIYQTRIVCAVGKLSTMNSGEIFRVRDAVPFKPEHKYWRVVNPIYKYLWTFLEDPEQWCDPYHVGKYRLIRIDKTDPDPDYKP